MSTLTLETALDVLSSIAKSSTSKDRDRITAIMAWARMTGHEQPKALEHNHQPSNNFLELLKSVGEENKRREFQHRDYLLVEDGMDVLDAE